MRPKVKFLTVVWGEAYITRFATPALPSFLAPGNLPALAAGSDLGTICPTRFVAIDDLITTSAYGFPLTLAYARAVSRIWLLVARGRIHDDPVLFAVGNRTSYAVAAAGFLLVWLAT
jgi:hypothetical protein